jgi:hypothetical protein
LPKKLASGRKTGVHFYCPQAAARLGSHFVLQKTFKESAVPAAPDYPSAPDLVAPKRALLSVSDKTGLVEAAQTLHAAGVELVSTGGTKAAIAAAGIPVKDVSDLTQFPEMMDGRVKTLHPIVHGGLLGVRDAPEHAKAMADHGIGGIDILYVNLYPFEATVAKGGLRRVRREHRHRRPGHDPLGGQEPRLCRRLHRSFGLGRSAGGPEGRRHHPGPAPDPGGPRLCPHGGL